jgi:hypothetical protein
MDAGKRSPDRESYLGPARLEVSYLAFDSGRKQVYRDPNVDKFQGYFSVAGISGEAHGKPQQVGHTYWTTALVVNMGLLGL